MRATGGFRFVTDIDTTDGAARGDTTKECTILSGVLSCTDIVITSDLNAKANFASLEERDILERLDQIPVESWNYKSQDPSIRHIGPMAQDFYVALRNWSCTCG